MNNVKLMNDADRRTAAYAASVVDRPPYPSEQAIDGPAAFVEAFPANGRPDAETLAMLDDICSTATAVTTGPRYYGYVVGGSFPPPPPPPPPPPRSAWCLPGISAHQPIPALPSPP